MGKTSHKEKTPPGKFMVTTPKNPLINNQTVTSMRNLTITLTYPKIPTYNWTFVSIPNWTWSCTSLLSFVAQISNLWLTPLYGFRYVTNFSNLNDCSWLQSYSLHKRWRSRNTWLQNLKAYKHSSFRSLFSYLMTIKINLIYD